MAPQFTRQMYHSGWPAGMAVSITSSGDVAPGTYKTGGGQEVMDSLLPVWVPQHRLGAGVLLNVAQWDLTSCLPQNHWYVSPGGPVAQQVRDTCVPSATT